MRKLILLLLSLLPIMGLYGEPEIELKEIPQNPEHNSQIPVFHAELELNQSVFVTADQQSTFTVSIYDATHTILLYQGETYDGYYHFANTLSAGSYSIEISCDDILYEGEFEVGSD
ncbi:MAG: hypothetical protein IKH58_11915 [Bacteroidales bacterium]|nr:hypothetical protein [Bacteroidales bacterium]